MREPPLNDRELRILRGMLDEYDFRMRSRARLFRRLSTGERIIIAALAVFPAVDVILRLTGH
jgi:hypothetical protein